MTSTERLCPSCRSPVHDDDRFCERCGARLEENPEPSDRVELDLGRAAAVSDRGRVHHRNEDAFFLEVTDGGGVTAVVCDGISSASAGNVAAREAAAAAGTVLARAMARDDSDARQATVEALQAADGAVERVEWTTRTQRVDPSCTLVSALCRGPEIVIGWAGDSRAYWIDDAGVSQLTVDDSFAAEGISKGLLTPAQAAQSPFMHSITNWVGPAAPERAPRLTVLTPRGAGRLLLCTDGLWNYAPTVAGLAELIDALPSAASPAAIARLLADAAVARGGRDNITVVVVDHDAV